MESSQTPSATRAAIDPKRFRQVLGQYPTGVCVITSIDDQGKPIAMIVGSFTSVSLNPPLVAFFPAKDSSSWAKLRHCRSFCVNVLSSEQEAICRKLSSKDSEKFAGTAHRLSSAGNPVLDGVVAWIDCDTYSVSDAGDHEIVLGRVLELDIAGGEAPLLFFKGGYGRFSPASLAALDSPLISQAQLRLIERARPLMENLARQFGAGCIASIRTGSELVVAASAGTPRHSVVPMLLGQRLPFRPPSGSVFAAWLPSEAVDRWLQAGRGEAREGDYRLQLAAVRKRGYSVGLLDDAHRQFLATLSKITDSSYESHHVELQQAMAALTYDPEELSAQVRAAIRLISVPIFAPDGNVVLALTLHSFRKPGSEEDLRQYVSRLRGAAQSLTAATGGRDPDSG